MEFVARYVAGGGDRHTAPWADLRAAYAAIGVGVRMAEHRDALHVAMRLLAGCDGDRNCLLYTAEVIIEPFMLYGP
jgi:hypothetical protein